MDQEATNTSVEAASNLEDSSNSKGINGLLTQENSELRDRVADLEQRLQTQSDELVCLKSALSDCLRRLASLESSKAIQSQLSPRSAPKSSASPRKAVSVTSVRRATRAETAGSKRLGSAAAAAGGTGSGGHGHTVSYGPASPRLQQQHSRGAGRSSAEQPLHVALPQGASAKEPVWVKEEGILRIYMRGRAVNMYSPSDLIEQVADIKEVGEAPSERLKLEWVYGYRGRDCRSNLYYLPTGEMVYFIASIVVLHNVEEGMQRHYIGHNDDVKCLAVHPDKITIATGQVAGHDKSLGKPHVRIWNSVDLNTMHVLGLGDFERAVCCLSFSKADGGDLLCAIDEANEHIISVWEWRKAHKITETKSSTEPVLGCEFHPSEPGSIITCGKNMLCFWTLDGCQLSKKNGIYENNEKPKFVLCMTFAQNGDLITGDSNGNIFVWARGSNKISHAVCAAHDGAIFSLCLLKDDSLVSGGKDRRLVQWDAAYNRTSAEACIAEQYGPVRTLAQGPGSVILVGTTRNCILQGTFDLNFSPIVEGHFEELWGLDCHPNQLQFASCAYDKQVVLWDALTHQVVWTKELNDPVHCAAFHPTGETLAVGCQTARWYVLDTQRREIVAVHTDGSEQIECIQYSPDGSMVALGSRDNCIYVYACTEAGRKFSRIGKCCGHSSFITHIDWSADSAHLRSNSGDYELLFWTSANCRQVSAPSSLRDVEWASLRCTLSFHSAGIWPEGADGTDVNACDRNRQLTLVASGDDFGQVNLYRHPCYQPRAKGSSYAGHSSHVTNVRFLRDDSRLISTGGKDCAVLQWEVI